MTIRVLLADDHPIIRKSIQILLARDKDIEVVGLAENGQKAIELVVELKPDVLVLDYQLPDQNGGDILKELKSKGVDVKVLIFSGYSDQEFIRGMLEAGADGYLTKDEPLTVLVEAIKGVGNGQQGWMSRKVKAELLTLYSHRDDSRPKISPREAEVVMKVTEGKTNRQIAYELGISEKTVEKYIYSLFQKYDAVSRVQLAVIQTREKINNHK